MSRIFALLPAAGNSERMGRPKLALPLGDSTVLQIVVAALRRAAVEHVLVVIGPHVPQLVSLAEVAGAETLLLAEETADMRATVMAGLRCLEQRYAPCAEDAWLLVPADHPTLDAEVIRRLIAARESSPNYSIFIPTFGGRRGHPALIAWHHVAGIRSKDAGEGLNAYLRQQAAATREVPATAEVLRDLDTPQDYERLRLKSRSDES